MDAQAGRAGECMMTCEARCPEFGGRKSFGGHVSANLSFDAVVLNAMMLSREMSSGYKWVGI